MNYIRKPIGVVMETITIRLDDELASKLDNSLLDGRNKSAFIREAIQEKINAHEAGFPAPPERTIIYLLLEALKSMKSQRFATPEDIENLQECLFDGYAYDYEKLNPINDKVFPTDVAKEVREILFLHRVLANMYEDHGEKLDCTQEDIRFEGFDGNEETEHFSYANFVLGRLGEFKESSVDHGCENTHWPILASYRAMLREWGKCENKYKPTKTEFSRIIKAKKS